MYKVSQGFLPAIITELFKHRNKQHHNPRNNAEFTISAIKLVYDGSESISFLGPNVWNILPDRLKNAKSLEMFKLEIKK